jgi:Tfp pilus assembly protein PilW
MDHIRPTVIGSVSVQAVPKDADDDGQDDDAADARHSHSDCSHGHGSDSDSDEVGSVGTVEVETDGVVLDCSGQPLAGIAIGFELADTLEVCC